jgi:hypothetical protein
MLILGIILALVGWLVGIYVLFIAGIILLVLGAALFFMGTAGHPVGGRRYWW